MDTATAARTAGVTVATIRTWCRRNVVGAIKVAGRWIIEATSLTRRIQIGTKPVKIEPLTRVEFETAARALGIRTAFKDARCHGEYQLYIKTGQTSTGTGDYEMLMVRRGAALAAEGYAAPAPARGPGYAAGLPGQVFGGPSADRADECHYCGQPLGADGECEDCR